MQIVRESAHLFNNPTDEMGYGIPNFEDAYNALQLLGNDQFLLQINFALYPNPVNEILNISFPTAEERATVTVYNLLGEKVFDHEVTSTTGRINIAQLRAGMYLVSIKGELASNTFKIVKR